MMPLSLSRSSFVCFTFVVRSDEGFLHHTTPRNIKKKVVLKPEKASLTIEPLLLNAKDRIKLKFLILEYQGPPAVDGRIAGIKDIYPLASIRRKELVNKVRLLSVLIIALLFILLSARSIVFSHGENLKLITQPTPIAFKTLHKQVLDSTNVSHLEKKWAFQAGGSVHSSLPTIVNGVVYVGSSDGNLYAIDAVSGNKKWAFQTPGTIDSPPIVVNGVVYVISSDGNLYAIDTVSGNKKWAFQTRNNSGYLLTVVDGIVFYVGSSDGNLYAIDAVSGNKKWAFQKTDTIFTSPTIVNGVVYVASDDGNLYAIDAVSGNKKWTFQMPAFSFINSELTVTNRVVYVGSSDHNLYAIDAASGRSLWAFQSFIFDPQLTVVDSVVYFVPANDILYAFALPETSP